MPVGIPDPRGVLEETPPGGREHDAHILRYSRTYHGNVHKSYRECPRGSQ